MRGEGFSEWTNEGGMIWLNGSDLANLGREGLWQNESEWENEGKDLDGMKVNWQMKREVRGNDCGEIGSEYAKEVGSNLRQTTIVTLQCEMDSSRVIAK